MVESYEYIYIKGISGTRDDTLDPGEFECFQGMGASFDLSGVETSLDSIRSALLGGDVGIDTLTDITPALWGAQDNTITTQTAHIQWLKEQLGNDASGSSGITGVLKGLGQWFLKEGIKQALAEIIEHSVPVLDLMGEVGDDIADFIAEGFVEGTSWLIDFFEKKAAPNVKRCEAMLAENNAMLDMELSTENYRIRNDVLNAHSSSIADLESQLVEADGKLLQIVTVLVELVKSFATEQDADEEEDGWDTVMTSLGSSIDNLDEWVNNVETADTADTPVPSAPSLPAIPDDGKKAVSRKIAFLLARYGFKLATELLRKNRETDTHITDLVEQIKNLNISLQNGLGDLKYNDEIVDFGSVRIHHKAKIIETS